MANYHRIQIRSLTLETPAHALEVDLQIGPGEMLALVGASGAGKSRLLRIIAGLERPISGQVELLAGTRAELISTRTYDLHPRQKVREHLEAALKKMSRRDRPSSSEQNHRIAQTLELLELAPLSERKASALSSGERRCLAVGCGLVLQPQLFLFDEPLLGLEGPMRARIRSRLLELHRELGCSSIFATQDAQLAMGLGTRMAMLHEGSIVQSGSAQELYCEPAHRSVAAMFGMNFLEGRLDVRDGERFFAFADGENEAVFPLSFIQAVPDVPGAEPGKGSIVLGILPESIRIAGSVEELGAGFEILEPALPDSTVLPGWEAPEPLSRQASREEALRFGLLGGALRRVARVRGVEWLGRETRLLLDVGGQPWEVLGTTGREVGDRLWIELERDALRWFDAQGARLRAPIPAANEPAEPLSTLALEEEAGTRGLKISGEKREEEDRSAQIDRADRSGQGK